MVKLKQNTSKKSDKRTSDACARGGGGEGRHWDHGRQLHVSVHDIQIELHVWVRKIQCYSIKVICEFTIILYNCKLCEIEVYYCTLPLQAMWSWIPSSVPSITPWDFTKIAWPAHGCVRTESASFSLIFEERQLVWTAEKRLTKCDIEGRELDACKQVYC